MKEKFRKLNISDKLKFLHKLKFIKRMDRYIIAKFIGTYFYSIALIISISIVFDIMFYTDIICHSNVLLYAGNKKKQVERLRNRKITERKGLIHEYSIVST